MNLSFSHLLTIFVILTKHKPKSENNISSKIEKFILFLNQTYIEKKYPQLRGLHFTTVEILQSIEDSILISNITTQFKVIQLKYTYYEDSKKQSVTYTEDILVKDAALLYEVLTTIYCLIKGFKIEETEDNIVVTTPTNNRRTIRYNNGWYCDCSMYNNYHTCSHIKLANTYLKHRIEFNK